MGVFDVEAAYWTLSTLAQVLVALVAFLGFFAAWQMDHYSRSRQEARERLIEVRKDNAPERGLEDSDLIGMAEEFESRGRAGISTEELGHVREQLQQALSARSSLGHHFRRLAASGLVTVAVSLLGLSVVPWLATAPLIAAVYFALLIAGTGRAFLDAFNLLVSRVS